MKYGPIIGLELTKRGEMRGKAREKIEEDESLIPDQSGQLLRA